MKSEKFGEFIRSARIAKGISLRELARRINVSHPYLSQLENGHNSNPSLTIIQKLSNELEISFVYLVYLSDTEIGFGIKDMPENVIGIFKKLKPSDFEKLDSFENFKNHFAKPSSEEDNDNPNLVTEERLMYFYKALKRVRDLELNAQINVNLEEAFSNIGQDIHADIEGESLLKIIGEIPKMNRKAFTHGLPIPVYVDENNNVNIQIIKDESYLNQQDMKELNSMIKGFLYNKKFVKANISKSE